MNRSYILKATIAIFFAMFGSSQVRAQAPSSEELLVAMRSGVGELTSFERGMTSYKCRITSNLNQKTSRESTMQVWRSGESILIETANGKKRGGLNANYLFGVERGRRPGEWKLTEFVDTERVREFDRNLGQYRYVLFPLTATGSNLTLQEKIDNPRFRITATRLGRGDTIEADFATEEKTPHGTVALTGTITVSAKQRGLVLAYQHQTSSGSNSNLRPVKYTMTRQVDEVGSGYQCKSLTSALADPKTGDVFQNERTEFLDYGTAPSDPAEFYLTHYGLPEPTGFTAPSNRTPRYVWFLLAAGVFAFLAILLRWRSRRWRSAASMPSTTPPKVN